MAVEGRCTSCGRAIIWAQSPAGKNLPLDARAVTVYRLEEAGTVMKAIAIEPTMTPMNAPGLFDGDAVVQPEPVAVKAYVSHFLTCPNAASHSRKP